jgi:hypothetical protein
MSAVIHINNDLPTVVDNYYKHSPQEDFNGDFFKTGSMHRYNDLNGLINHIIKFGSDVNIIVNHASDEGLIISFGGRDNLSCKIEFLKAVCDIKDKLINKERDITIADNFGFGDQKIIDLAKLISRLKKSRYIIIRGCNIGKDKALLRAIGRFFNAWGVHAPTRDQFYVPVSPKKLKLADVPGKFAEATNTPSVKWSIAAGLDKKTYEVPERNKIAQSLQSRVHDLGVLAMKVTHEMVPDGRGGFKMITDCESWATDQTKAGIYGQILNRLWYAAPVGPSATHFIVKLLWDTEDNIMWFPAADKYFELHASVTNL